MVLDQMYFGQDYHLAQDVFNFVFGCVHKETNLFFSQAADGILGLGGGLRHGVKDQRSIYDAMYR